MKNRFGILAVGVLAACGSSSSNNNGSTPPTPTSYTYGSGTPVSTGSDQESAANDANQSTQQVVSAAQGSVTDNASTLTTAPQIPNAVIADLGDAVLAHRNPTYSVVGKLAKATKSGALDTGCYTVNGDTITYNSCNLGDQDFTYTVSGSLTATPTSMTWNIKANFSFSDNGESENLVGTWTGNLTFAVSASDIVVDGTATAAYTGNVTGSGQNVTFAYTAQVVFKSLDISNTCDDGGGIDSGKLDVSVTAVASNGTAAEDGFENFGYEFTWNGCDTVSVATGTAN